MTRRALAAIVIAAQAAFTASAAAQNIDIHIITFEGRDGGTFDLMDLASTAGHPITAAECDAGPLIQFRFNGVDTTRANLFWFTGSMCTDTTIRNDTTNTTCQALDIPSTAIEMRSEVEVLVPAGSLVPCDQEGGSGVRTIWVLALNDPSDPADAAGQSGSLPIAYDFRPPDRPSDLSSGGGEDNFTLTFSGPTEMGTMYEVFIDPTGCTDGTVTSTALMTDPPDASYSIGTFGGTGGSIDIAWPDSVAVPGEAAVAMRAIDPSGNIGALSDATCVQRYDVVSPWDMRCSMPDPPAYCSGGGCSAAPSRKSGALVLLCFGALALFFVRRRQ